MDHLEKTWVKLRIWSNMCNETKVVRDACCVEGANRSPKFLLKQFYVQLLQHLLKLQGPGMSRALPGNLCISKLDRTIFHVPCCMDGWFARAISQARHDYPGRIMYRICRPMYPPAVFVVGNLVARAASRCDSLGVLRLEGNLGGREKVLKVWAWAVLSDGYDVGGGNSNIFLCSPLFGEGFQFD